MYRSALTAISLLKCSIRKEGRIRTVDSRTACGRHRRAQETEEGYLFASDLNTPRRFETLASMLADRGHQPSRIEKILGKNLLRVFSETWKA